MKVQGFWHGPLGTMEKMCINSYIKQGIDFVLYGYELEVGPGPHLATSGLTWAHAGHVVPEEKMKLFPWASIFSDYFRYALLAEKGGFWIDLDTICLKPMEYWPQSEYVFARDNIDQYYISGFVMKAPQNATIMNTCRDTIDHFTKEEIEKLGHMDIGPYMLQKAVPGFGLSHFVAEPYMFDPIPWNRITDIVKPEMTETLEGAIKNSALIHLRQSIWNEGPNSCAGILPDGTKLMTDKKYPENSLWEILKRRYL
jgi:hypothetical protein